MVESDDKKIEKKDKNLDEPVQFYTGKDKLLYELVINTINKNQVIGYLATPKNAPTPIHRSRASRGLSCESSKPQRIALRPGLSSDSPRETPGKLPLLCGAEGSAVSTPRAKQSRRTRTGPRQSRQGARISENCTPSGRSVS